MKGTKALDYLDRTDKGSPQMQSILVQERLNAAIARMIYEARSVAGLTQKELAKKVGTTQSVIARLEDADYEGHSLTMIKRIAIALDLEVDIRLHPKRKSSKAA